MINKLYSSLEIAKTGSIIPVLYNGKTLESKYNPEKEADQLLLNIDDIYNYFIITGICSGILIKKLIEKKQNALIICLERTNEDIDFLKSIDLISEISTNKNIFFVTPETIESTIINTYLPAKYGDIKLIERHPWISENSDIIPNIKKSISKAIGIVSADYSVQVHFGKTWQTNILNNLLLWSKMFPKDFPNIDYNKNAYIVAAGPTLDTKISKLKTDTNKFIISTDTAYSSLLNNNIIPDVVISIDGQTISSNHFIKNTDRTIFLFDLCGNNSAARHIFESDNSIYFFKSGHPFVELANIYSKNRISNIFSGSGTVTITALDFAIQCGFKNITILGADFGYSNGKAYTKGTYFDVLYNKETSKINSNENSYNHLMYRTEINILNGKQTTPILNAYQKSLEDYLEKKDISYIYNENEYRLINNHTNKFNYNNFIFDYNGFLQFIKNLSKNDIEIPLLPLVAWYKNNYKSLNYEEIQNLALSFILSYN